MKLFKRSLLIYQFMIFLFLSYIFLYVLTSLNSGESALDWLMAFTFTIYHIPSLIILIAVLVGIYKVRKWSKITVVIFFSLIFIGELEVFFQKFDKIVLVLMFVHILLAFNYFLLWDMELGDVVYCPGFTQYDCGKKYLFNFSCEIETDSGLILPVKITNWDRSGVFCLVDESDAKIRLGDLGEKVIIRVSFEQEIFEEHGKIISSYDKGYGIKFIRNKKDKTGWGWQDFYTIIRDRGYTPDFIRT